MLRWGRARTFEGGRRSRWGWRERRGLGVCGRGGSLDYTIGRICEVSEERRWSGRGKRIVDGALPHLRYSRGASRQVPSPKRELLQAPSTSPAPSRPPSLLHWPDCLNSSEIPAPRCHHVRLSRFVISLILPAHKFSLSGLGQTPALDRCFGTSRTIRANVSRLEAGSAGMCMLRRRGITLAASSTACSRLANEVYHARDLDRDSFIMALQRVWKSSKSR